MIKSELLVALGQKFYKVLEPQMQRTEAGITWYLVGVYDQNGTIITRQNISFYVEGEGQAEEVAYWQQVEPKAEVPQVVTFPKAVDDYIDQKVANGVIEAAIPEKISELHKVAVYMVYRMVADVLTESRMLLDKDAKGNIRHRIIS